MKEGKEEKRFDLFNIESVSSFLFFFYYYLILSLIFTQPLNETTIPTSSPGSKQIDQI